MLSRYVDGETYRVEHEISNEVDSTLAQLGGALPTELTGRQRYRRGASFSPFCRSCAFFAGRAHILPLVPST